MNQKNTHNLKILAKAGMFALCAGISLYVFQVSFLTEQAYRISSLERDIAKTQEQLRTLSVTNTRNFSHQELGEIASSRKFTRADRIVYLRLSDSTVAQALDRF